MWREPSPGGTCISSGAVWRELGANPGPAGTAIPELGAIPGPAGGNWGRTRAGSGTGGDPGGGRELGANPGAGGRELGAKPAGENWGPGAVWRELGANPGPAGGNWGLPGPANWGRSGRRLGAIPGRTGGEPGAGNWGRPGAGGRELGANPEPAGENWGRTRRELGAGAGGENWGRTRGRLAGTGGEPGAVWRELGAIPGPAFSAVRTVRNSVCRTVTLETGASWPGRRELSGRASGYASFQGFTVRAPVFRKSRVFRVTMVRPRRTATAARKASGSWASNDSPRRRFLLHDPGADPRVVCGPGQHPVPVGIQNVSETGIQRAPPASGGELSDATQKFPDGNRGETYLLVGDPGEESGNAAIRAWPHQFGGDVGVQQPGQTRRHFSSASGNSSSGNSRGR